MNNENNAIPPRRGWVMVSIIGCALVTIAMLVVGLSLIDKKHFEPIVGMSFLVILGSGVLVGSLMVLVAALVLPNRTSWRNILLMLWGLIGITSPFFGYLFLLPWGAMLVLLPGVIIALASLYRASDPRMQTA